MSPWYFHVKTKTDILCITKKYRSLKVVKSFKVLHNGLYCEGPSSPRAKGLKWRFFGPENEQVLNCRPCLGVLIFTCLQFHKPVSIATHISNHIFFNEGEK